MKVDREETRQALLDCTKLGKVSGIRLGIEVLRHLAKFAGNLDYRDLSAAADKMEATAKRIEAELPPSIKKLVKSA